MCSTTQSHGKLKLILTGISIASGIGVMGLGLLVIFGWHTDNRTLVQVVPTFAPMHYNTALGFVLCGGSLLLLIFRRDNWAAVGGGLAALIGSLTLLQYIADVNVGIDELLMEHHITVATSHAGRMAPNSAVCFTLMGLAVMLQSIPWRVLRASLPRVILASFAFGLGAVALSGYYTRLETAYGWGNLTHMSVHSSFGFVVISLGLLCFVWSRNIDEENWLPRWMPIPSAIAILTATLCFWQAFLAESQRIKPEFRELSDLTNIATLLLIAGMLLAVTIAAITFLIQKTEQRAREVARANQALEKEVAIRQRTEIALEVHRDHLEELVDARTQELDMARQESEAANRAKSEFLSHMSHELRTPLNGILGYAQILQRDADATSPQRGHLRAIVNCGDHLLSLINDVLDLSKIEAGRLEVDGKACDLHGLVRGVANILRERAVAKGLTLDVEIAPQVPRGVVIDAAKLRQILVNLLGNGVKFTQQGGVSLHVAVGNAKTLRFTVSDTGVGINSHEIEGIFNPFKQMEAGKAAGGTGLGLAITRRLVEALGGTVEVQSEKDKGSVFSVALPLVEAEGEDLSSLERPTDEYGKQIILSPGQTCSILVADDSYANRDILRGMLIGAGFDVTLVSDGDEALELLRGQNDVGLVLMDMRMPRINGMEALKFIRADKQLDHLKVIAVTASVFPEFKKQALEAGFDDFLAKPFRVEELMDKLQKHLDLQFTSVTLVEPPCPTEDTTFLASEELANILPQVHERLRRALKVKNLTAIKAVGKELADDAATATAGAEIIRLVEGFDFDGLEKLTNKTEQNDD